MTKYTALQAALDEIIEAKQGNKEIAIFYLPELGWYVSAGNTCTAVMLGESDGEINTGYLPTITEAVEEMRTMIVPSRPANGGIVDDLIQELRDCAVSAEMDHEHHWSDKFEEAADTIATQAAVIARLGAPA